MHARVAGHGQRFRPAPLDDCRFAEGKPDPPGRRTEPRRNEPVLPRRDLLAHDAPEGPARAGRGRHAANRVRDGDLVERFLESLGCEPRGEVAGHVVEAERREHGDGRVREALVDQARELLLAARVDVVGADGDGRLRRLRAQPEERPGT